jgi:hypothetical protein
MAQAANHKEEIPILSWIQTAIASATLVALAQERGLTRVFTLDGDFHVYRLKGRRGFEVVP